MSASPLIQPDQIRRKALRQYPKFVAAWLIGESTFPLKIVGIGRPDADLSVAQQQVSLLRSQSKEVSGAGYSIDWEERNSRHHGRNLFPQRIWFETEDDFLSFTGRKKEFARFADAVQRIRAECPKLESWIRSQPSRLMEHTDVVEGLLEVVTWLESNPRPGLFARELPLNVDTKFIQRHSVILSQWLNAVLPPESIRADESHFERRFGLRYAEPMIHVRFLDSDQRDAAGSSWESVGVPLHELAANPFDCQRVVIVENRINLLTLPSVESTIGLGGLGNAAVDLSYLTWLQDRELWYWGDLDVEGFEILSRLRSRFGNIRSLFMDTETLSTFAESLAIPGTARQPQPPPLLTDPERAACDRCMRENLRIEQERIPQSSITAKFNALFNAN